MSAPSEQQVGVRNSKRRRIQADSTSVSNCAERPSAQPYALRRCW